jgi:hypothetical protein
MKPYISPEMQSFLKPNANEEAVDQPLYHIQSYGTAGATSFTFFNVATGGLTVTNMDSPKVLSKGKRFAIFGISIAYLAGQSAVQSGSSTTVDSALKDAQRVLEGASYLQVQILDKFYLTESPLTRIPSGQGLWASTGGIQRTQAVAADGLAQISYAANGMPVSGVVRKLRVPIPLPEQVQFNVTVTFPTAVTVNTAGSLGCWLDGMLLRARQ